MTYLINPTLKISDQEKSDNYMRKLLQRGLKSTLSTWPAPHRWNPPWYGEGEEGGGVSKRFQPLHQQEELVGAMQLRLNRTNRSSLDYSSLRVFSIFSSFIGFGSRSTCILYQYISSLEVKYHIFRNGDEGTFQKHLE